MQAHTGSNCPSRESLEGFHNGLLSEPDISVIAIHLSGCQRCEDTLRSLDGIGDGDGATQPDLDRRWQPVLNEAGWERMQAKLEGLFDTPPETVAEVNTGTSRWLGQSIGNYQILEELGRGGMGVVYKARQRLIGREVALKMILAGLYAAPEHRARFRTEGTAAARLDHPGIVRVHDFAEHEGLPYYTMELIEGESLSARLKRGTLQPREAAELVMALAQAVDYAHQRRVLHRDLKPANVLLQEAPLRPKITDFGLAKLLDCDGTGPTEPEAMLGTPSYMAPEQTGGQGKVGPATDVWGLGVILYECLAGRPPFRDADKLKTIDLVRHAAPPPLSGRRPDVPRELEEICLKCLEKEPAARHPSAGALAADLQRWLQGERPSVASTWSQRGWRRLRRPLAAVVGVVAICALAASLHFGRPAPRPADEVALERHQTQLEAGQAVTLIDTTGKPQWSRWEAGEQSTQTSLTPEGEFAVHTWAPVLLELLPDPRCHRYRISAQVRHLRSDRSGEVGLYCARQGHSGRTAPVHYVHVMTFNDVRRPTDDIPPLLPNGTKPPFKLNSVRLFAQLYSDEPNNSGIGSRMSGASGPRFNPAGTDRAGWRNLAIDVTPEGLTAHWDGESFTLPVGEIIEEVDDTARRLRAHPRMAQDPAVQKMQPTFSPRGGLGLYLMNSSAAFRDVRVTPLPQP